MFDFLFPNHTCLVCKDELNGPDYAHLCGDCIKKLPINTESVLLKDSKQKQYFYKAISAFNYEDPVVNLILRLKYNSESIIATALAPYMAAMLLKIVPANIPNFILMPVPLFKKRQRERGYNQSELLANELSLILHFPVVKNVLVRTKHTEMQKEMTIQQRAENLKNAFETTDVSSIKGKKVLLVDDVFTSGSTTNECARILKRSGVKEIIALTIASVG